MAHAQSTLALDAAQRVAVERSRQVAAQDAAIAASREMAVAARRLPDPVATVGINNLPVDGPDRFSITRDFMTMRSVGVMQEFTREAKRDARAERLLRQADQSRAEKDLAIVNVRRESALAWLDRYYAEAMAAVVAEQSRQARLEIEAAENAYRSGRGNLADVLGARSALTVLDDRASELARRAATARIALSRFIGDLASTPLAGRPAIDTIHLDPATLDTDLQHHPDLAVLATNEDVAAADVRVAESREESRCGRRGPDRSDHPGNFRNASPEDA
jgi:outer membrane protein TolC